MPGCFMPFAEPWCPNLPGWILPAHEDVCHSVVFHEFSSGCHKGLLKKISFKTVTV